MPLMFSSIMVAAAFSSTVLKLFLLFCFVAADNEQPLPKQASMISSASATISPRAELPMRRDVDFYGDVPDPICGYVTSDLFNPVACGSNQYCINIGRHMACCSSTIPYLSTWTVGITYTYTYSLTSSGETTSSDYIPQTATYFSYTGCDYATKCFGADTLSSSSICTGACLSNPRHLFWFVSWPRSSSSSGLTLFHSTNAPLDFCLTLTLVQTNQIDYSSYTLETLTAFECEVSQGVLPMFRGGSVRSNNVTGSPSTTQASTSSSFSPTQFIHTDVTQSSRPAPVGSSNSGPMSTSTNQASKSIRWSPLSLLWTMVVLISATLSLI